MYSSLSLHGTFHLLIAEVDFICISETNCEMSIHLIILYVLILSDRHWGIVEAIICGWTKTAWWTCVDKGNQLEIHSICLTYSIDDTKFLMPVFFIFVFLHVQGKIRSLHLILYAFVYSCLSILSWLHCLANMANCTNLINVPHRFLITFDGRHGYTAQYPWFIHTVLHLPSKLVVAIMTASSRVRLSC